MTHGVLPPLREVVAGLHGRGVVTATPEVARRALPLLREAGYEVVTIDGTRAGTRREALAAIAAALDLPGAADHNLDALLDTLRDLPDRDRREESGGADAVDFDAARGSGLVLLWTRADRLRVRDPRGWRAVCDVLVDASEELRGWGFAFETLACEPAPAAPPPPAGAEPEPSDGTGEDR